MVVHRLPEGTGEHPGTSCNTSDCQPAVCLLKY